MPSTSPRWYMKMGRVDKAFQSLKRLRNTELQAARDLYYTHVQLEAEKRLVPHTGNYFTRLIELFTIPRVRRATLGSVTVMVRTLRTHLLTSSEADMSCHDRWPSSSVESTLSLSTAAPSSSRPGQL